MDEEVAEAAAATVITGVATSGAMLEPVPVSSTAPPSSASWTRRPGATRPVLNPT